MNREKIEAVKRLFLTQYPDGFEDEKMLEIKKKHKPEKMRQLAQEVLAIENFENVEGFIEDWGKLVTRSSMVSVFEKVKFRDLIKSISYEEKEILVNGLKEFLYGDRTFGFQSMIDILGHYKLAKWTLLTSAAYYLKPTEEVFIKPTTTKMAINFFELKGVKYSPKASYEFYEAYRIEFLKLKKEVGLTDDNAAFGGFIMMVAGN